MSKKRMSLNDEELNLVAEKVYAKNKKATLWDVLVQVLAEKGNVEPFVIWILSDLPVLEAVAKGHSLDYIASFLDMPHREVIATCNVWGVQCFRQTLDFDPTLVYNVDMTMEEFQVKLDPILPSMPATEVLEDAIINVEKYRSVKELLEEWGE
jgi:hypothetical protein